MSEFLLREKEFLKLNEELNVKTKILLEKPTPTKENRHVAAFTRNGNGDHESKEISHSPRAMDLSRSGKPPIKPRVNPTKSYTIPRNSRPKPIISVRNNSKWKPEDPSNLVPVRSTTENNDNDEIKSTARRAKTDSISVYEIYKNGNFAAINSVGEENTKSEVENVPLTPSRISQSSISSLSKKPSSTFSSTNEKLPRKNLSSDGLIKFLKSKVAILQDELEISSNDLTKKTEDLSKCLEIQKRIETQRDQAISKNNNLTNQVSKLETKLVEFERKRKEHEAETTVNNREMETLKREIRLMTQTNTNLEKRLYRANEELENVRNSLATVRDADREMQETIRKEKDEHERQMKTLKKQRTELMTAYKKQLYLLDNLKRQNTCLEQARLISFAEKEFTKVLEWDSEQ